MLNLPKKAFDYLKDNKIAIKCINDEIIEMFDWHVSFDGSVIQERFRKFMSNYKILYFANFESGYGYDGGGYFFFNNDYKIITLNEFKEMFNMLKINDLEVGKVYKATNLVVIDPEFKIDEKHKLYKRYADDWYIEDVKYNDVIEWKFKEISQTHTVSIDGKQIEISHESYLELKKAFEDK